MVKTKRPARQPKQQVIVVDISSEPRHTHICLHIIACAFHAINQTRHVCAVAYVIYICLSHKCVFFEFACTRGSMFTHKKLKRFVAANALAPTHRCFNRGNDPIERGIVPRNWLLLSALRDNQNSKSLLYRCPDTYMHIFACAFRLLSNTACVRSCLGRISFLASQMCFL